MRKALAWLLAFHISCSSPGVGEPPLNREPGSEDSTPFIENENGPLEVGILNLNEPTVPELPYECRSTSLKQILILPADSTISIDGQSEDWDEFRSYETVWRAEAKREFKILRNEVGLYLGGESILLPDESLIFESLTGDAGGVTGVFSLSRTDTGLVLSIDGISEPVRDRELARFAENGLGFGELYLSNVLLDRVLYAPVWSLKVVDKESEPQTPSFYFKSPKKEVSGFGISRCYFKTQSEKNVFLQIVGDPKPNDFALRLISNQYGQLAEKLSERSLIEIRVAAGLNQPLTTQKTIQLDSLKSLTVASSYSANQQFAFNLIRDQYKVDSNAAEALSSAIALNQVKEFYGTYDFLVQIKNIIESGEVSNPNNLGILLALGFTPTQIKDALISCESNQNVNVCLSSTFSNEALTMDLFGSWREGESHLPGFEYTRLLDEDQDGLILEYESQIGSSDRAVDSDFDGWSDLSESVFGYDALTNTINPKQIVVDGLIGDWLSIIPAQVLLDKDKSSSGCELDLNYYNALRSPKKLYVAAELARSAAPGSLSWELVVNTNTETYTVTMNEGERSFLVNEQAQTPTAFHNNTRAIEIALPLLDDQTVSGIQIKVFYEDEYCDTTDWFIPRIIASNQLTVGHGFLD